jgi:2-polyprenyl-3-methyl-5-hydroxy-6-metoxy-1,4-benzoquinol methylase
MPEEVSGRIQVVKCDTCGLLYTHPRPDQNSITMLYQKYYDSSGNTRTTSPVQSTLRNNLVLRQLMHFYFGQYLSEVLRKSRGRVLDIGCGTGGLLQELVQKGCEGYGVELNPDSVKTCREKGLNVQCGELNTVNFPDDFFDTIIMWHVMEHLPSPKKAFNTVKRLLKPGGRFFIYSPNAGSYVARLFGVYWCGWHIPFHYYHFSPTTVRHLAESCGFSVVKSRSATPEYYILSSLSIYINHNGAAILKTLQASGFLRTFFFRFVMAPILRIFDVLLTGQGECLRVELRRAG